MSRGGPPDIKGMSTLKVDISGRPPPSWNVEDLTKLFDQYGEVGDVFIPRQGKCGFAFVRYFRESDSDEAMRKMNGYNLDGTKLTVIKSQVSRGEKGKGKGGKGRSRSPSRGRGRDRSRSRQRRQSHSSEPRAARSSAVRRRSPTPKRRRDRSCQSSRSRS
mmetsp:Transcript_41145/g.94649  ORF Transcript_41145/g.94649 Transcript_41145/m.94649 type:complete len:161 (-) Transcript_41145:57-539(-)